MRQGVVHYVLLRRIVCVCVCVCMRADLHIVQPLAAGALELVYWLRKVGYRGHVFFDTFPLNEDPVQEAVHNVGVFKEMWQQAQRMDAARVDQCMARHDTLCAMGKVKQTRR